MKHRLLKVILTRIGDEEERVKFKDMEADWHRWEGGDVAHTVEEKEWLEVVI